MLPLHFREFLLLFVRLAALTNEVKEIHNQAIAMEVYAYKAKDAALVREVVEIRKRAERRLGQIMDDLRKAGMLAKAGRHRKKNRVRWRPNFHLSPSRVSTRTSPIGRARPVTMVNRQWKS
jgi:hypothetical protein